MSPYTPFRSRRGIHHFLPIRVLENIWFFFSKSSWGMKIVIMGIASVFAGLFFPWIQIGETTHLGAFSLLCGAVGWWISILMLGILIHFFSYDLSQKIQKSWHINLDPRILFVRVGSIIVLMTLIVSISLTGAARTVNQDISMTIDVSGLVLTLMGGILLVLGGIVVRRKEEKDAYKHVFVQGVENEDTDSYKKILGETEEGNMKLPI
jgi:hypothetical protein